MVRITARDHRIDVRASTALRVLGNDAVPMRRRTSHLVEFEPLGHAVQVVGPSVADIVGSVGGWLFDRSMAGWRVTAVVAGDEDERPLRILGVSASASGLPRSAEQSRSGRRCLAVAFESFKTDPGVRRLVLQALDDRSTEVTLWGGALPPMLNRRLTKVHRRVGAAAAAFKTQALAVTGSAPKPTVDLVEVLHTNARRSSYPAAVRLDSRTAINDPAHGGMQ